MIASISCRTCINLRKNNMIQIFFNTVCIIPLRSLMTHIAATLNCNLCSQCFRKFVSIIIIQINFLNKFMYFRAKQKVKCAELSYSKRVYYNVKRVLDIFPKFLGNFLILLNSWTYLCHLGAKPRKQHIISCRQTIYQCF